MKNICGRKFVVLFGISVYMVLSNLVEVMFELLLYQIRIEWVGGELSFQLKIFIIFIRFKCLRSLAIELARVLDRNGCGNVWQQTAQNQAADQVGKAEKLWGIGHVHHFCSHRYAHHSGKAMTNSRKISTEWVNYFMLNNFNLIRKKYL